MSLKSSLFEKLRPPLAHIELRTAEIESRLEGFEGLCTDLTRIVGQRLAKMATRA